MSDDTVCCLIVDDEPALRRVLIRALEGAGYHCIQADSGVAAIQMLEQHPVTVMITDLRMPELDGTALLEVVRERWPDVAAIVMSAVAEVTTAVTCLHNGAFDYLTKPFQIHDVQARVQQALERRRLVLENRRYQEDLADRVRHQAGRIEELFVEGVQTLVHALEAKDLYTSGHSTRVAAYASTTAVAIGLSDTDIQLIGLGAELHDVGKIGVREDVLHKTGPLSAEEYEHIMQHTIIGHRILAPLLKNAPQVLDIVRSHHERVDGRGLPDGLTGDQISLHARVVAVADAFDAMTSGRPYRSGRPAQDALEELLRNRNKQFDSQVTDAFVRAHQVDELPIETPVAAVRRLPAGVAGGSVVAPIGD